MFSAIIFYHHPSTLALINQDAEVILSKFVTGIRYEDFFGQFAIFLGLTAYILFPYSKSII